MKTLDESKVHMLHSKRVAMAKGFLYLKNLTVNGTILRTSIIESSKKYVYMQIGYTCLLRTELETLKFSV